MTFTDKHLQMNSRLPALGPRGEGWVVAQLVLFAIIAAAGLRDLLGRNPGNSWGPVATLSGLAAIALGGLVAGRGVWDLRAGLSPFPRPVAGAPLIESGAYRFIRHPIYSGLVVAAIGWGITTGSILALMTSAMLFLLFAGKSRREEVWLAAVHPEYRAYQQRTRRLIPWIY
jgi:protein-S-isoprenylcysteine O-methyltransferase Ste14